MKGCKYAGSGGGGRLQLNRLREACGQFHRAPNADECKRGQWQWYIHFFSALANHSFVCGYNCV